jgi:hypothetical protein
MSLERAAAGVMLALIASGYVVMMFGRGLDDSPEAMRRMRLNSVEGSIARYTRDVGHLPRSLDQLIASHESGWRGPYAMPIELEGRKGALIYTIVDTASARYRLAIAAQTLQSGAVMPETVHERRVRLVESQ